MAAAAGRLGMGQETPAAARGIERFRTNALLRIPQLLLRPRLGYKLILRLLPLSDAMRPAGGILQPATAVDGGNRCPVDHSRLGVRRRHHRHDRRYPAK